MLLQLICVLTHCLCDGGDCVQDYVDQLAAELEATKHTGGDEASDRMLDLIQVSLKTP